MAEPAPSLELAIPFTGELVNLDDGSAVAKALDSVRQFEYALRSVKDELSDALVSLSKREGTKTLHLEGAKATIKGGNETVYDAEEIEAGLREAGMSEERIRQVVKETTTYAVSGTEAKKAAGANPAYKAVIDAHSRTVEKRASVTISLG